MALCWEASSDGNPAITIKPQTGGEYTLEVKEVMFSKAVKVYVQKDIVKLSIKASDSHVILILDTEYFTSGIRFYISIRGNQLLNLLSLKTYFTFQLHLKRLC